MENKNTDLDEITWRRVRAFGTQLFSITLCFLMMCLSIKIGMKVTPILFAVSVWCGTQDAFWATVRNEDSRKTQFEFWFYHLTRMWAYSLGFLSFAIEWIFF